MAGDDAMDVFSVWKRHIVALGSSMGTPKDMSAAFERRGARPHYVRHEGEFHWIDKPGVGMPSLPQVVLNHHQNNPRTCFYDVFADIDRAWASVDNTLYIWCIGDKEPTPVMYSHEAQYITCVGLAPVKRGIFMVSVKYLLVVCTNVEVTLVGICFSNGRPDGQLQLTPLAGYSVPCSTTPMAAACATASGHIFLGATDGNVYQVQYGKRQACRLTCVSRSFLSMLGAGVLPGYLAKRIWNAVPIRLLVVDNDRHFLYTLSESHTIRAFHLGPDGDTAPQEFALVQNVHEASASVPNAASVMTRERGRAPPAVVHLAVIPPHASRSLHVVAVLADGCRVFFEAMPARRTLRARAVMPNDGLAGTAAGLRGGGNVRAVRAAVFASNTLLVVESGTLDSNLSELIATLPNPYCAPPQETGVIDTHRGRAMEVVAPGAELLPGDVRALREIPAHSPLKPLLRRGLADEATLQLLTPAPQFVAMSNVGIVTFTRRRPLDVLKSLLINFNEETVVNFFFGIGPAEASCACFAIATAAGAPTMAPLEATSTLPIHSSQAQADRALSCLSDPKYIGTAMWPSDPGMPDYAGYRGRGEAGQYGSVLSVTEPEWSHMHVGLVLFVYRLLHKVWDLPLLRVVGSGTGDRNGGRGGKAAAAVPVGGLTAVELALPVETLEALQGATAALGVVVVRVLDLLQGRGVGERKMWTPMEDEGGLSKRTRRQSAALLELERVAAIGKFAHACAEALLLCRKLVQYNVGRHLQKGRSDLIATCERFRLSALLSQDGMRMATGVLMDLLKRHTPSGRLPVSLADDLLHGCPMFFPYHQQQYLSAFQQLEGVNKPGVSAAQKEEIAAEFMGKMTSALAEAVVLRDIIPLLLPLGKYQAIVQLSIAKADAQDASGKHLEAGVEGANAASGRAAHFLPLAEAATSLAGSQESLSRLLRAALATHDPVLSHLLFRALIADGAGSALISSIPDSGALRLHLAALGAPRPYVLKQEQIQAAQQASLDGDQLKHLALLAELFVINRDHVAAAEVMTAIGVASVLPSTPESARPDRVMALQQALVHAGNSGDTALERRTESEWRQARIQAEVLLQAHRRLRKAKSSGPAGDADRYQRSITKLQLESLSMNALFNDFALPMSIWNCGLLIMRESNAYDDGNVRQLWDLLCKDEVEGVYRDGGSTADALRALCSQVIDLAGALGATPWLHVSIIALRLLQVVAGHWVARDVPLDGPATAAKCLCDALPDGARTLLPVLVDIVRQRSPLETATAQQSLVQNEAAWDTVLRCCQLYFRSAVAQSQGLAGGNGDGARNELEALLDAVRTFAAEAAKHAHLAPTQRRFDETAAELQKLISQRRRTGHFLRR